MAISEQLSDDTDVRITTDEDTAIALVSGQVSLKSARRHDGTRIPGPKPAIKVFEEQSRRIANNFAGVL